MPRTFLRLSKIYNFVNGNQNSRNINEGEEVLKSGQILAVGCTNKIGKIKEILGLVLQTSGMTLFPHTITGSLHIENFNAEIVQMKCSCKAGLSGTCKHIVAVFLYLERYVYVLSLPSLSILSNLILLSKS